MKLGYYGFMKLAAGLLLYRMTGGELELLLVHPGGPFYAKKDDGVWSIPKGEIDEDEDLLAAAKREFEEELGSPAPSGKLLELGEVKQSGKANHIWALEADFDASTVASNNFEMEWPPKSGQLQQFPEVDRASWFNASVARTKLRSAQVIFIDRLEKALSLLASEPSDENQQTSLI